MRIVSSALCLAALLSIGTTLLPSLAHAEPGSSAPAAAVARLVNRQGQPIGAAVLVAMGPLVRVDVTAAGLTPGDHGVHIHTTGQCTGPDFTSAGAHFNPASKKHGLASAEGPHAGDLPNLKVGADGNARAQFMTDRVTLAPGPTGLLRDGGTAIVIHAAADDGMTDPSGSSGDRIACGVIEIATGAPPQATWTDPPADLAQARARYEGLSAAQVRAMGYLVDTHCVTAADAGLPAEMGNMGYHATHPARFGEQFPSGAWRAGEPPILILDMTGHVVGVEWESAATVQPSPSLFGQVAPLLPGHEGPPEVNVPHHMLHAYFGPGGKVLVDTWNPNLECPTMGHLAATRAGVSSFYSFDYPGNEEVYTVNLRVKPDNGGVLQRAGFRVYNPNGSVHVVGGAQAGLDPNVSANVISRNRGRHIIEVYNANGDVEIDYELSLVRRGREGSP